MFKDRGFKLIKLIGMSITAFVILTSVSWASSDLFKNPANELLKAVAEELKEEPQKEPVPATGAPKKSKLARDGETYLSGFELVRLSRRNARWLSRQKTRDALTELQRYRKAVDLEDQFIPKVEKLGSLSNNELNFFKTHYFETATMKPQIYFDEYNLSEFIAYEYFEALVLEATGDSAHESRLPPGQCYAEGDKVEPLFYCTFSGGKKELSICEELDEDAESEEDRNTLSYKFGRYNSEPEIYLYEKIELVFRPTENYTPNNVPMDTSNEFVFSNIGKRYVITANTWVHSKGRGLDGSLTVVNSEKILAQLTCDEGSIVDNSWDGYTHAKLNQLKASNNICEGKYLGFALKNNVFSKLPEDDAGYPWSELMKSNSSGSLHLIVKGSEDARYKLVGFAQSMTLTTMNEANINNNGPTLEECFGDWCSVCDTWPGTDQMSCYTIHDANRSGLMLAFDSIGRAVIHEECYPKLSYPCSFAGRSGESISVQMELFEHGGSSAKIYGTGVNEWDLSCY